MGKIKKILENELLGGTTSNDVYPITSTQAVYTSENKKMSDSYVKNASCESNKEDTSLILKSESDIIINTITIPAATIKTAGVMSAEDKNNLSMSSLKTGFSLRDINGVKENSYYNTDINVNNLNILEDSTGSYNRSVLIPVPTDKKIIIGGTSISIALVLYDTNFNKIIARKYTVEELGTEITLKDNVAYIGANFRKQTYPNNEFYNYWFASDSFLTTKIDDTNTRIDEANIKIDEANIKIDDTNTRIDDTNTRIDDVNTKINETNIRIDETNARVDDAIGFNLTEEFTSPDNLIAQGIGDYEEGVACDLKKGSKFSIKIEHPATLTRLIVCYNAINTNRLFSTSTPAKYLGKNMEFIAPEDIQSVGLYLLGDVSVPTILTVWSQGELLSRLSTVENNTDVLETKLSAVEVESITGSNLLDQDEIQVGKFLNTGTALVDLASYNTSGFIPVTPGKVYKLMNPQGVSIPLRSSALYDEKKTTIKYTNHSLELLEILADGNAKYIRVSWSSSKGTEVGLFETSITQWEEPGDLISMTIEGKTKDYNEKAPNEIALKKDIEEAISDLTNTPFAVELNKNGNNMVFSSEDMTIETSFDIFADSPYFYNPIFNFSKYIHSSGYTRSVTDDVAPAHVTGTTIGANHGQPCYNATVTAHGLNNTSIGTTWVNSNGIEFIIMRIIDNNNIQLISKNYGTASHPSFRALSVGTLTLNGQSITIQVSAVANTQLWPSAQNINHKILIDGKTEVLTDGNYGGNYIDVIEEYDVADPISVINNIIARAGSNEDPVFTGNSMLKIQNTYRFLKGGTIIVFATWIPIKEMQFGDIMFAQSELARPFKYYIPNSNPIGGLDFRKPINVTWSSSVPYIGTNTEDMANPNMPVNRIVTYGDHYGFALGFLPIGIGASLNDYTTETFEIRKDTGKIYPHGVNTKIGATLQPYQSYSAALYRAIIDKNTASGNRMSMYSVNVNGDTYIYLDYSGSMLDKVTLDSTLEGRTIEVVESVNTKLITKVYSGGFYVHASYVEDETCFIVLKI